MGSPTNHKPRPRHAWLQLALALATCSAILTAFLLGDSGLWTGCHGPGMVEGGEVAVRRAAGMHNLLRAKTVFQRFLDRHQRDVEELWKWRLAQLSDNGIVIAAGRPETLANAFVSLHVLRHTLGSQLPVTIMYWGRVAGDVPTNETMAFMQRHITDLDFLDASALPWPAWHRPLSKDLDSWKQADGWKFKAFVLYAAPYKHVMFLDSDATAAINPEVLFEHPDYLSKGSMFWSELWCGDCDLFRQLKFTIGRERQTESGIFLVDRRRHWLAVEWALWLNVNDEIVSKLAYGDKDTFRAAFFLSGKLDAFHQLELPLALMLEKREGGFFNRGYLQPHPNGSSMFVHRVSNAKYDLWSDDPKKITHVTVPSCNYFSERGWNSELIDASHFQPQLFSAGQRSDCNYSMHSLYNASRRCGKYDYTSAGGKQQLPVFQIPSDDHVGTATAAAEGAFRLLRDAVQAQSESGLLFRCRG